MATELKENPSRSLGSYSIPDAARYISATAPDIPNIRPFPLNTRHLYYWTRDGLAGGYLKGIQNRHLFINFRDLVSLRIIAAMRANGITHREIMDAENRLKRTFGWEYPFAMSDFWVAKPDIYMKIRGELLSVSRGFQYALEMVNSYIVPIHGLTFDLFGVSTTWTPHNDVLLDPEIQFGSPCITGTRVPTEVIWSFNDAGDSVETIAFGYGLNPSQIRHAIDWETRLKQTDTQE